MKSSIRSKRKKNAIYTQIKKSKRKLEGFDITGKSMNTVKKSKMYL